ncbi:LysR substrate-binding domain-containing protein [Marinobacter sp. F4216]|uniref:LysR substrate-binding domain-containing protein n=1 Tax=Marinobacter sp. F4216 TaxID=2874281 RepID=UPI001CC04CD4|nr:LysR substrate-binding domain-containing protein [Marinobacter sp. F4216]MBZ2169058.1 LysR family transcriptional regulator [Marinobacter sp. F4216]
MRSLNFHHLYYFRMVAREGNLTRAATQLHVSQSALSSQIRKLEQRLGRDLFIRDGRTLRLTETGHLVLAYADTIFNLGGEMLATVESGKLERVQRLRIGAVATLSRNFQENFLRPVVGEAQIKLVIHSASQEELLEQLKVHKLDLILSNRPVATDSVTPWRCQRIAQRNVCLVGPAGKEGEHFRFPEDLPKVNLLVPGPSSNIRSQFDMLCQQLGVEIEPYAEVDDMAMLRLLARDSGGVAVVPEVVVQDELKNGTLQKYAVLEGVMENFYAITTKRHFDIPVLKTLLDRWKDATVAGPANL